MIERVQVSMSDRLINAASELFYAQGLRAVSVDKVIERAGTTKVTFYRHFKSKDDLVVAYLEQRATLERDGIGAAIAQSAGDAEAALRMICDQTGIVACSPGFRGCPFINAAAENPDPESPVRKTVAEHRDWYRTMFGELLAPLDLPNTADVVDDLMLLRDGAMVAGYLGDPSTVAGSFFRGCQAVIWGGAPAVPAR
ncbi:TetR/AcrR family transcriptional regulator [Aeromicrobium chenweiae]|uniref:TetR family transcriptional regulator n=1 Tax=Aeromicrobium chenweiae TaxID=2079793 RepID=A0A2S0WP88_9ACTN|nr:TetR/AcrR family transcriptional regulator [Aeromicrobium chenweiae]AWB93112.1 TetR family transcriptional regulator [Aeromicrobium chenweiae]TGN34100.1 TetR/AcrR family transcriptional regulator [Aeromicrobium chenweiae]